METFAQKITKRRQQLDLTQREVAEALGIPLSTYKEWEYGRRIQGEAVYVKLAEVLHLNLRTLLMGEPTTEALTSSNVRSALKQLDEIKSVLLSFL